MKKRNKEGNKAKLASSLGFKISIAFLMALIFGLGIFLWFANFQPSKASPTLHVLLDRNTNNGDLKGNGSWGEPQWQLGSHTLDYQADDRGSGDGNKEWNFGGSNGCGCYEYDVYHEQSFNVTGHGTITLTGWLKAWAGWWSGQYWGWDTTARMELFVDGVSKGAVDVNYQSGEWDTWVKKTITLSDQTVTNNITVRLRGWTHKINRDWGQAPIYFASRFDDIELTFENPSSITVIRPNGGEYFAGGTTENIKWNSSGVSEVKISYSIDGGDDQEIVSGYASQDGENTYTWTVPVGISNSHVKIKIENASVPSLFDTSDYDFTIVKPTTDANEWFTVLEEDFQVDPPSGWTTELRSGAVSITPAPSADCQVPQDWPQNSGWLHLSQSSGTAFPIVWRNLAFPLAPIDFRIRVKYCYPGPFTGYGTAISVNNRPGQSGGDGTPAGGNMLDIHQNNNEQAAWCHNETDKNTSPSSGNTGCYYARTLWGVTEGSADKEMRYHFSNAGSNNNAGEVWLQVSGPGPNYTYQLFTSGSAPTLRGTITSSTRPGDLDSGTHANGSVTFGNSTIQHEGGWTSLDIDYFALDVRYLVQSSPTPTSMETPTPTSTVAPPPPGGQPSGPFLPTGTTVAGLIALAGAVAFGIWAVIRFKMK